VLGPQVCLINRIVLETRATVNAKNWQWCRGLGNEVHYRDGNVRVWELWFVYGIELILIEPRNDKDVSRE